MYSFVTLMLECPTASAITRTLTPLVESLVMNVRLPLWLLAPTIPTRSYKRFMRVGDNVVAMSDTFGD